MSRKECRHIYGLINIGCLWCTRSIRRQTYKEMALGVSFDVPGIGQISVRADFHDLRVLVWLNRLFPYTKATHSAYVGALTLSLYRRLFVAARKRGVTSKQFANFIMGTKSTDLRVTSVNFSASGHKIELLGLLNFLIALINTPGLLNSLKALINTPTDLLNSLNALINTPAEVLNSLNALYAPMKPQLETAPKGDMPPKTIT
jgi:hypothetical protein